MPRSLLVILALLAGVLVVPFAPHAAFADTNCPTAVAISQGAGTLASPYEISVPGHLQTLRDSAPLWNKYFLVTTDIDMSSSSNPCIWTAAIGTDSSPFTGQFDGGGHVISGLNVSLSGSNSWIYGGLVGKLTSPGVVTRVGFTGSSSAASSGGNPNIYVGGLVGYVGSGATVSFSYATGSVASSSSWSSNAGGLVGRADGTVRDSYSMGSVSASVGADRQGAGGFFGFSESNAAVTRVYSTGVPQVGSGSYIGGFAGIRQNGSYTANFWDTTSSTKSAAYGFASNFTAGVTGKTTAQMQSFATFDDSSWPIVRGWAPFDIASNKVWGICEGSTRPFLLWQYTAQTRPCASVPSAPTITGVTPSGTSAAVAFNADDSGGDTITRLEFALDDTITVDDSTTNIASPKTLSGLTMSTNYTVYMRAVNSQGSGPWSTPVSFRTQGRPGIPVATGVTPDLTSVSVAFTADDSGGRPILAIQYALDDTNTIYGSSTNVSPVTLAGLTTGTPYRLYVRAMNSLGPSPWSAATSFTTLTPPPSAPPVPIPASAPLDTRATAGDASLHASWSPPLSSGDYPVTHYQATASPGGRSCMTTSTACTIDGLTNGTAYTVTVRALSGAGWSAASAPSEAVVPRADQSASLTIAGSRGSGAERSMITVRGTSTGLAGARVTLWLAMGDRKATPAAATVQIKADGTFTWSRKLTRAVVIYAEAGGMRSNVIRLPAVR